MQDSPRRDPLHRPRSLPSGRRGGRLLDRAATLIGTSTNIAASGYMKSAGLAPLSMFELLPVGGAVALAGILYLVFVEHRWLPRTAETDSEEAYSMREYLSEVVVTPGPPLAGIPLRDSPLAELGVEVRGVLRRGSRIGAAPWIALEEGDLLLVQARREALLQIKETAGIEIRPDLTMGGKDAEEDTLAIAPGKYRFRDFVRTGVPLTILIVFLILVLVPVVWPVR